MRVHELIYHLMNRCQPTDIIFVNAKPAAMTTEGTGYISITDHVIERRIETVTIHGEEFEVLR